MCKAKKLNVISWSKTQYVLQEQSLLAVPYLWFSTFVSAEIEIEMVH